MQTQTLPSCSSCAHMQLLEQARCQLQQQQQVVVVV
jgi:hypothetical protein